MRFYTSMVLMLFYVRCSTNLIKIADYIILNYNLTHQALSLIWSQVRVLLKSLGVYMIVNFRIYEINQGVCKLVKHPQ